MQLLPKKVSLIFFYTQELAWFFGQFVYNEYKMSFQHWFILKIMLVNAYSSQLAPSAIPFSSYKVIYSLYTDSLLSSSDPKQLNHLQFIMLELCIGGSSVCTRI